MLVGPQALVAARSAASAACCTSDRRTSAARAGKPNPIAFADAHCPDWSGWPARSQPLGGRPRLDRLGRSSPIVESGRLQ